jgi:hypothetical protein
MQHPQDNYGRVRFGTLVVAVLFFTAYPALAGSPDPLLHYTPQSACQAGATYVAGVDADDDPVVPADVGAARAPVSPQIVMPLPSHHRAYGSNQDSGYVVLDGRQVEKLIDPKRCH